MSERDVEDRVRKIVGELGSTEHTPIEIADLYLCKLKINNEEDLRNCAIIIKKGPKEGKKQITLRNIGHQVLKAVNSEVDLVILIHIASLADDVKDNLINLCNKIGKMYCIVDKVDLARLFKAYRLL